MVESHLLAAMLRARKQYQHAGEGTPDETAALESAYKRASREYHDFVSKDIVPENFSIVDSGTLLVSEYLSESDSGHDQLRTKLASEESMVGEIGFAILSRSFEPNIKVDRRVGPQNRRNERRIDAQRASALLSDAERFRVPVVILDVSASGLGISTEIPLPPGNAVLIELNDECKISGIVRYCREDQNSSYLVGIRISRVTTGQGREV